MKPLTIDFETFYDKEYSLSKMTTEEYLRSRDFQIIGVGVKDGDDPAIWFSGEHGQIASFLHKFDITNRYVLAHNMMFDGAIMAWHLGIQPKYYLDTLSMARPISQAGQKNSLAALAKRFCVGEKGNEVVHALGKRRDFFYTDELERYGEYCKNDVDITYRLFQVLRQFSSPRELYVIDLFIRMFTDPVVRLDTGALYSHLNDLMRRQQALLDTVTSDRSLLMSNPKFADLLRKYGVDPPMKFSPTTGKETYAFAKSDHAFLALQEHPDPDVQALVAARLGVKSTIEMTRTARFISIAERGTLPVPLAYYAAHTGRAGGADKINLQNLPRKSPLRSAIRPPPGHVVGASDSSQIEARVVALLAGQYDLVEDFRNKVDIYSSFASDVYGFAVNKAQHPTERFVGKTCILGLGYGMGYDKFQLTLKNGKPSVTIDPDEAVRIVSLYRNKYQQIANLWKSGEQLLAAMQQGLDYDFGVGIKLRSTPEGIELPNGMKLRYEGLTRTADGFQYTSKYGSNSIYGAKVVENVVQALARIIVFDQMCAIDQLLKKKDDPENERRYKVVFTVHDEVVFVVPEDAAEWACSEVHRIMHTPPAWAPDLPVACEVGVGRNYADCK